MKKETLHPLRLLLLAIVTAVVTIIGINLTSSAQEKPKFKVGDRIECNTAATSWYKGTVVPFWEHDLYNGHAPESGYFYRVKLDGSGMESQVCKAENMRPLGDANTADKDDDRKETTGSKEANGTKPNSPAPEKNGAVNCPPSDPDANGKTALDKSFRGAIRTSFERKPKPGEDGRVTVTIQSLSIGQAHSYRPYIDPNEARGKTIYPIRAMFTACTDYNRRIVLDKRERAFACYKNIAGEWVCDIFATAGAERKDESTSIDKPRK